MIDSNNHIPFGCLKIKEYIAYTQYNFLKLLINLLFFEPKLQKAMSNQLD